MTWLIAVGLITWLITAIGWVSADEENRRLKRELEELKRDRANEYISHNTR